MIFSCRRTWLAMATWFALVWFLPACAQVTVPTVTLDPFVTSGINGPIAMAVPHDGSKRLFVVERTGAIKVVDGGSGQVVGTYLAIDVSTGSERGLLAMAFDPNFAGNPLLPGYGEFYLAFTAPSSAPRLGDDPDQVLRRYTVADPSSNDASGATWVDVMRIPDLYGNHNGADLHFGPDGYLYYSMGDGGSGGDPNDFAQNTGRKTVGGHEYYLLGKMMRIDVHSRGGAIANDMCGASFAAATPGATAEYAIPPGNPFILSVGSCNEIWLYGLRNPFRFSFDRASGDLFIGDVGQNAFEEVDMIPAGPVANRNLGWKLCEGFHYYGFGGSTADCPVVTGTVPPIIEYPQSPGCAVTGGVVYRGPIDSLQGAYIYSDSCSSQIWFARKVGGLWNSIEFTTLSAGYGTVVDFGEDEAGNVYVVHMDENRIYRFNGDHIFADGFEL